MQLNRYCVGKQNQLCGQICVAPDYALVPKEQVDQFAEEYKRNFTAMYGGNISNNSNYTSIVNDPYFKRLLGV